MNHVPRRFRLASHVGGVRRRLADKLVVAFREQHDLPLRVEPADLRPAQGAWRTDIRMDVYRWEGWGEIQMASGRWMNCSINSWDTMTACLRGLVVDRESVHSFLISEGAPEACTESAKEKA